MNGKKLFVWALLCVLPLCTFCSVEQLPSKIYPPSHKTEPSIVYDTVEVLCFSAIRYEDGYDWNKDAEYGRAPCSLLLFVGDSLALNLPVGETHARASDSDMHHLVGADLYEDYSTKSETIVSKNGVELFRLPSREMICDLRVIGEGLYTLGSPREGGGYILRKDGDIIAQSPNIYPKGKLYEDGGALIFNAVNKEKEFYVVENGAATLLSSPSDTQAILDYRRIKAEEALIGDSKFLSFFAYGGKSHTFLCMGGRDYRPKKILYDGLSVLFWGYSCGQFCVWNESAEVLLLCPNKATAEAVAIEGDDVRALLESPDAWHILTSEGLTDLPKGYRPHSSRAMLLDKGKLYLSLVDNEGHAAIWMDGRVVPLGFNGYVDGFSIGKVVREK